MEPLDHLPVSTAGIDDLVEALLVSATHLNVVLMHMHRCQLECDDEAAAEADPIPIVLRRLLRGTLAPLADGFALADIQTATRIVNRATAVAEREIILVPPGAFDDEDG